MGLTKRLELERAQSYRAKLRYRFRARALQFSAYEIMLNCDEANLLDNLYYFCIKTSGVWSLSGPGFGLM